MAVPKKRTSKSKKNIRKTVWKNKAKKEALKALSIAKYIVGLDLVNNPSRQLGASSDVEQA